MVRQLASFYGVIVLGVFLGTAGHLPAQDLQLPPIEFCRDASSADNERSLTERVGRDATRLQSEAGGNPLFSQLPELLKQLYGCTNETIEQRLKVCRQLHELNAKLPSDSTALSSVKRQIQRRVDVVEAGLLSAEGSKQSTEVLALTDEIAIRTAIDFEMSGRAFHGERVL